MNVEIALLQRSHISKEHLLVVVRVKTDKRVAPVLLMRVSMKVLKVLILVPAAW